MIGDRTLGREDFPFPLDRPITGQDLLQLLPRLFQPLWSQAAQSVRGHAAQVIAVKTNPKRLTVVVAGREVPDCRYLASYTTPTVGDMVLLLHTREAIVLGKLA